MVHQESRGGAEGGSHSRPSDCSQTPPAGLNKYRDKFMQDRCRYTRTGEQTREAHDRAASPADIYRFNGELVKTKVEEGEAGLEDILLNQIFRDQEPLGPDFPHVDHLPPHCGISDYKPLIHPPPAHQQGASQSSVFWPSLGLYGGLFSGQATPGAPDTQEGSHSPSDSGTDSSPREYESGSQAGDREKESLLAEAIRLGKDEKIAREAGINFNVKEIVNLPMDEFNDLLSKHELTEEQLNLCRDIRRRGKNKVAAQNCRKRKIDQIDELQERLNEAVRIKNRLKGEHERLISEYEDEAGRLTNLTDRVLLYHNKSPSQFTVQVYGEDQVRILPKSAVNERDRVPQVGGRRGDKKPVDKLRMKFPGDRETEQPPATSQQLHYMRTFN